MLTYLTVILGESVFRQVSPMPLTGKPSWIHSHKPDWMGTTWSACKCKTGVSYCLLREIYLLPSFAHSIYRSNPPKSTPMNLVGWCKCKTGMSYRLFRGICLSPSSPSFAHSIHRRNPSESTPMNLLTVYLGESVFCRVSPSFAHSIHWHNPPKSTPMSLNCTCFFSVSQVSVKSIRIHGLGRELFFLLAGD